MRLDPADSSVGSFFHKEKRSKKENIKGQLSNSQLHNYTIGKGSTTSTKPQEANANRSETDKAARRRQAAKIDAYLSELLMEGIVSVDWLPWHAKCIYTLSLERYNLIVIQARNGKQPAKLLSDKLKGAMEYQKELDAME